MSLAKSKWIGVTVIIRNAEGAYLIHRRKDALQLYGAPGGVVERGESILSAAVRETREEVGRVLVHPRLVGYVDLLDWIVFFVRGDLSGSLDVETLYHEVHKAGPWQWIAPERLEELRNGGHLQTGLEARLSGRTVFI